MPSVRQPTGTHLESKPDVCVTKLEKTEPPDSSYEVFKDGYSDSEDSEDSEDDLIRGPMRAVTNPDRSYYSPNEDVNDDHGEHRDTDSEYG